ncbi:MAG: hypothetical protein ABI855_14270 [Bacteroidota bacterium]
MHKKNLFFYSYSRILVTLAQAGGSDKDERQTSAVWKTGIIGYKKT